MIPGGLVATYGLRSCPRRCAGRCQLAREYADGRLEPSRACELMSGPRPAPGEMPALDGHEVDQLHAMAREDHGADRGVSAAARRELDRRSGA